MRKLIIVVISMLVPFGLWTAGCRQERDTAFPNTPEMKSLARAPEKNNPTRPPVIPAPPIDRDILHLPEHTTMASANTGNNQSVARADAYRDRSQSMAGSRINPGLFVLPEEQGQLAALPAPVENWEPYEVQPAPMAMTPVPSAREFWSKPVAPLRTNQPMDIPHGVSAMMPPAPPESMIPQLAPVVPDTGGVFFPEDIPGVFIDSGDYMGGGAATQPPVQSGWIGMGPEQGDALGAPPLLSSAAFESVPAQELGQMLRDDRQNAESGSGPIKLDLGGLLTSMRTIADSMIPAQETQAAQPSSPYMADLARQPAADQWKQSEKWSSALPVPAGSQGHGVAQSLPSLSSLDELREALSPLPDITTVAKSLEKKSEVRAAPVTMPPPMPEPVSTPEMTAAKSALFDYVPESRNVEPTAPSMSDRDYFRSDFWEQKPASSAVAAMSLDPQPVMIPEMKPERANDKAENGSADKMSQLPVPVLEVPELKFETAPQPKKATKSADKKPEAKLVEEPQKVKLQPLRHARLRPESDISSIDSAVAVPPLKF